MKKAMLVLFLTLSVLVLFSCDDNPNSANNNGQSGEVNNKETYVYITPTGTKYHKSNCYIIKNSSKEEISLTLAKAEGYTACGICY